MKKSAIAALAITAVLATACSAKTKTVAGPTVTTTVSTTATVTVTASPSAPPVGAPLAIGATYTGDIFTATVLSWHATSSPSAPAPVAANSKYADADVKVCITGSSASTVSTQPWALIDTNSGAYSASNIGYNQFPQPQYGFGSVPIAAGQCRQGYIVFVVSKDATIKTIQYTVQSTAGSPIIVSWSV